MKQVKFFEGHVNDKVFDNAKSMAAYINECIENGIDITSTSSHSEVRYVSDDEAENLGHEAIPNPKSCSKPQQRKYFEPIPEPYKSVEEYLVPFVTEEPFSSNVKNNNQIIDDTNTKMSRRTEYIKRNKQAIQDEPGFQTLIINRLKNKHKYCGQRTAELDSMIKNNKERIKRLQAEIDQINASTEKSAALNKLYWNLGTYCEISLEELGCPEYCGCGCECGSTCRG